MRQYTKGTKHSIMKNHLKDMLTGIVALLLLSIGLLIMVLPGILADKKHDLNYFWFYVPHFLLGCYSIGHDIRNN